MAYRTKKTEGPAKNFSSLSSLATLEVETPKQQNRRHRRRKHADKVRARRATRPAPAPTVEVNVDPGIDSRAVDLDAPRAQTGTDLMVKGMWPGFEQARATIYRDHKVLIDFVADDEEGYVCRCAKRIAGRVRITQLPWPTTSGEGVIVFEACKALARMMVRIEQSGALSR